MEIDCFKYYNDYIKKYDNKYNFINQSKIRLYFKKKINSDYIFNNNHLNSILNDTSDFVPEFIKNLAEEEFNRRCNLKINIEKFLSSSSLKELSESLEVSKDFILSLIRCSNNGSNYYKGYIKKKTGGYRIISVPIIDLKILQRKLLNVFQEIYLPSVCAYGFISGRSIIFNSINHVKKNIILNIDLKDFFPTISFEIVKNLFLCYPFYFNKKVSIILSLLCCNNGELPQGAPTSPIISNMVCKNLDYKLKKVARDNYCYYTRYVDDITFSTNKHKINDSIIKDIKKIIKEEGFKINYKKFRIQSKYQRQEVTGITVNLKPNVKRKYVRYIRALLHSWVEDGYEKASYKFFSKEKKSYPHKKFDPIFENSLRGKINYLGFVRGKNDKIYLKFRNKFNKLYSDTIKANRSNENKCKYDIP